MNNGIVGNLEIVKYNFQMVDGEPKIIISMIKVIDTEGNYIKFAKLKEIEPYLCQYPIKFKLK